MKLKTINLQHIISEVHAAWFIGIVEQARLYGPVND